MIDLEKLVGFGVRCARHTREFLVHAEIVLKRDRRIGDAFPLDLQVLFSFHRLMETIGPAPALLKTSGELIDDDHVPVFYDVVLVTDLGHVGVQRVFHVVDQVVILWFIQVGRLGPLLHFGDAILGQGDRLGAVLNGEVFFRHQSGHQLGKGEVVLNRLLGRPADDQRRARFVDEDVVHLVYNGEVEVPLHPVGSLKRHVVPQVVKTKLVVGAVGDVGLVCLGAANRLKMLHPVGDLSDLGVVEQGVVVLKATHRQAQGVVDGTHPHRVPAGQVVVDRDHVNALSAEGVHVHREGGDQRLALSGFHLGDLPLVQHDTAGELDVVVPLANIAPRRFPNRREGFGKQVIQGFFSR